MFHHVLASLTNNARENEVLKDRYTSVYIRQWRSSVPALDNSSDKFVVHSFLADSLPDPVHSNSSKQVLRHKLLDNYV